MSTTDDSRSMAQKGGLAPWQARRVESYVAGNLGGRIRTTDLAQVAQLSASHFTRAFKETFGETPIGYVARQRMRYAQDLMLKSGERLSQIALTCGHCDQSHFTRVFRRKVGMSPRAWRRLFGAPRLPDQTPTPMLAAGPIPASAESYQRSPGAP